MKLKLLVSRSGPQGAQNAGEIIEAPQDEALRMVKAGQAEPVKEVEKATKKAAPAKRTKK